METYVKDIIEVIDTNFENHNKTPELQDFKYIEFLELDGVQTLIQTKMTEIGEKINVDYKVERNAETKEFFAYKQIRQLYGNYKEFGVPFKKIEHDGDMFFKDKNNNDWFIEQIHLDKIAELAIDFIYEV